jgi:hypothetical protein
MIWQTARRRDLRRRARRRDLRRRAWIYLITLLEASLLASEAPSLWGRRVTALVARTTLREYDHCAAHAEMKVRAQPTTALRIYHEPSMTQRMNRSSSCCHGY